MTIAEVYGLKENPFEPTGAAVGKYPFVPPANFPMLEQKIEEAGIEKKLYALLVNSPHGAGKSTTMEYIKTKAINGGYLSFRAPVILTRLSNLSIQEFVEDILDEARKHGTVKPLRSKYRFTPSQLRKALVNALSPIATRSKLLLWIIDEFDILADRPKEEQQAFLQFLRGVIDDFAYRDIPIAFIMSHTKYSSREFERHLSQQHEPFRSRLVASLPLAYSFDEVKEIVAERLKIASSSSRLKGDISPFSEESLESLFELIISVRGTESLDNFRVFERVCHFALIEGAKRGLKKIDADLMKELFAQYGLKEVPMRESRRISIKTAQEIAAIKSKSLMERNEAILQGIITGISKSTLLGERSICNVQTSYIGKIGETDITISFLSFDLLHEKRSVKILWIVATSKAGFIQEKDLRNILQRIGSLQEENEMYSHIQLLSYVSSIEIMKIPQNSFERVLCFSDGLAEDLIGLSIGVEEDTDFLIKSFDSEIAPLLAQLVARETRDITTPLSQPAIEVIRTLYVMSGMGQSCTKEAIRQINKRLFMRGSKIQARYLKEAVRSGFAKEEAGQIKPSIPKAHIFLLELLEKQPLEYPLILEKLGSAGEAIIESALAFGIVYKDGNKIVKRRVAEYESELLPIAESFQTALENDTIRQSEPGKWIEWLLDAYNYTKKGEHIYPKYIVFSTILELAPQIGEEVKKSSVVPISETAPTDEVPKAHPPTVPSKETISATKTATPMLPETTKPIGDVIIETVQNMGAMSIQEIDTQLKSQGYEEDIKRTIFQLLLTGKLKVIYME